MLDDPIRIATNLIAQFEAENRVVEDALQLLFDSYAKNNDIRHVLLKTTALNSLYNTQIYALQDMADHILAQNVDEHLAGDSLKIVGAIATVRLGGRARNCLSFASKYCSWHKPDVYPIYDNRADECLWMYEKRDHFGKFKREELYTYERYVDIVSKFRSHYGLERLSFKNLDKFLYMKGGEIIAAKEPKKAKAKSAAL